MTPEEAWRRQNSLSSSSKVRLKTFLRLIDRERNFTPCVFAARSSQNGIRNIFDIFYARPQVLPGHSFYSIFVFLCGRKGLKHAVQEEEEGGFRGAEKRSPNGETAPSSFSPTGHLFPFRLSIKRRRRSFQDS